MPNVYVGAYGCSANLADAEIVKGLLTNASYTLAATPKNADSYVVLTCIVKTPTERKVIKDLKRLESTGKPLVIAGCMPQAMQSRVEELFPFTSMIGPNDIESIVEVLERSFQGERCVRVNGEPTDRTCLPRVRNNKIIHIAPISTGCLGDCSYCIVKKARGNLQSFEPEKILRDIDSAISGGCKEVWVTAEDTAAYRFNGVRLPHLIDSITSLRGEFMIRVGMMTPNQALPVLDDLIESYKNDKVFKFLHVPVQSGNDEVLKNMNRRYSVLDFMALVTRFRHEIPEACISTDIICGFPGETEEQFNDSLDLVKWLKPDVLNISRFWERPGTRAASLSGKLHGRETKQRSRRLTDLWREVGLEAGEKWQGWKGEILLDERGKHGTKVGRNISYKTVAVNTDASLGEMVKVSVTGIGLGFLEAEEIS
jgi:threonylcarbamoyladenosine tRNA methylthiotransferase CDKAL1